MAHQGDSDAQAGLGDIYSKGGYGLEKDYVEAWQWYQMSANQKNPRAQYGFGQSLSFGARST